MPTKLTVILVAVSMVPLIRAQVRPGMEGRHDPNVEYRATLDELFAPPKADRPYRFMAVLRFLPSFKPEEEIVLSIGLDSSRNDVTAFSLNDSIWKKLGDARVKHQRPTALDLAASAGLQQVQISVQAEELKRWMVMLANSVEEYSKSVRTTILADPAAGAFITVDGVHYSLVLETLQDRIAVDLTGSGNLADDSEEIPLVKAMKSIRNRVAELKPKH